MFGSEQLQLSAAGDNPLLKALPPADRRGAQMKALSERAPRGKYAGDVLEYHYHCIIHRYLRQLIELQNFFLDYTGLF